MSEEHKCCSKSRINVRHFGNGRFAVFKQNFTDHNNRYAKRSTAFCCINACSLSLTTLRRGFPSLNATGGRKKICLCTSLCRRSSRSSPAVHHSGSSRMTEMPREEERRGGKEGTHLVRGWVRITHTHRICFLVLLGLSAMTAHHGN